MGYSLKGYLELYIYKKTETSIILLKLFKHITFSKKVNTTGYTY